jgi:UDP-N-acetylglucosamine 1-carboxyvinyltransferase
MGVEVREDENGVFVSASDRKLRAVDVKTLPYPGFPTDMQAPMMALLMVSEGTSIVTETVFENRFMHVGELKNMNADIKVEGRTAIVTGGARLTGAKVCATDLRAGAALILAALAAEGETEITGVQHIDRGYVNIAENLRALGADIRRVYDERPAEQEQEESGAAAAIGFGSIQPTLA